MKRVFMLVVLVVLLVGCTNQKKRDETKLESQNKELILNEMDSYEIDTTQVKTVPYTRGSTIENFNFNGKTGTIQYISNKNEGHEYEATIEISGDYGDFTIHTKYAQYYTIVSEGIVYQSYDEISNLVDIIYLNFNDWNKKIMTSIDLDLAFMDIYATTVQYENFIIFTHPVIINDDGTNINQVVAYDIHTGISKPIYGHALFLNIFNNELYVLDLNEIGKQAIVKFSSNLETIEERIETPNISAIVASSNEMLFYAMRVDESKEVLNFIVPGDKRTIEYQSSLNNGVVTALDDFVKGRIESVNILKDIALITIYEGLDYQYYLYQFDHDFLIKLNGQYPFAFMQNEAFIFSPDGNTTRYTFSYEDLNAQFASIKESIK